MTITLPVKTLTQNHFEYFLNDKYGSGNVQKMVYSPGLTLYYETTGELCSDGITGRHCGTYNANENTSVEFVEELHVDKAVKHICFEFQTELRANLTEDEMTELIRKNRTYRIEYADCLSHRYCDANQLMLNAFNAYFESCGQDIVFDVLDEQHVSIVNEAWILARIFNFSNVWSKYENIIEN